MIKKRQAASSPRNDFAARAKITPLTLIFSFVLSTSAVPATRVAPPPTDGTDIKTGAAGTIPGASGGAAIASATSGNRRNTATATGGAGAAGVTGGNGGAASATTTTAVTNETVSPNAFSTAIGGRAGAGSSGPGGVGGTAATSATAQVNNVGNGTGGLFISARAIETGGNGGNATNANAGGGGTANGSTRAIAEGGDAHAEDTALGGDGGAVVGGNGNGGKGGLAISLATASNTEFVQDSHPVTASMSLTGGTGGQGSGAGLAGGDGGSVALAQPAGGAVNVSSRNQFAMAAATQIGGNGGIGVNGANGGRGADSVLNNSVSGTGPLVHLTQDARGGRGGNSVTGLAGAAGDASSSLSKSDRQDIISGTAVTTHAIGVFTTATGGNGGNFFSTGATGDGGKGGSAYASSINSGANGSQVSATSIPGNGGAGAGFGKSGGIGGTATLGSLSATSTNGGDIQVFGSLGGSFGGDGGQGINGANGGHGFNAALTNALFGATTGSLNLTQQTSGGSGGDSDGGAPGAAGDGNSIYNLSNISSTNLSVTVSADGGNGGSGTGTSDGANGGNGNASSRISGTPIPPSNGTSGSFTLNVSAAGGYGGSSAKGVGGRGGNATAFGSLTNNSTIALTTCDVTADSAGRIDGSGDGFGTSEADAITLGGASGHAFAGANTSTNPGLTLITQVGGSALAPVTGAAGATNHVRSHSSIGDVAPDLLAAAGLQGVAFITGLPVDQDSFRSLAGHPNVQADFNVTGTAAEGKGPKSDMLGLIGLGGAYSSAGANAFTYTIQNTTRIDIGKLTQQQNLIVGLLDSQFTGTGFDNLTFSISYGGSSIFPPLVNVSFDNLADAVAYFHDHPLDLGSISANVSPSSQLELVFKLDLTAHDPSQSFLVQVIYGNATEGSGGNTPHPGPRLLPPPLPAPTPFPPEPTPAATSPSVRHRLRSMIERDDH